MRKLLKIILVFVLCLFCGVGLIGCGKDDDTVLNIYMPDGAPALAMSKLMSENKQFENGTNYTVVSAGNIGNYIINKTADIAILPINMASKIIADGKNYKICATVTNGNLYIVGSQDISDLSGLTGSVIGVIGRNNVPTLNFKYLLNEVDVPYEEVDSNEPIANKVAIRYFDSAADLLPLLKQNKLKFGLLPEPAVSKLLTMATNFSIELDIQDLWEGGSYPQAVMVVRTSFASDKDLINSILDEMRQVEDWVISNPSDAVTAVKSHLAEGVVASLQSSLSATAISNCNIKIYDTSDASEIARMKSYLEKIRTVDSSAIGQYTDASFCEL